MRVPLTPLTAALVLSSFVVHADITLRYKNDHKFASLPRSFGAIISRMQTLMPPFAVVQVKGDKAYSSGGNLAAITDFSAQEITLFNSTLKTFATMPMKDYADKWEAAMPVPTPNPSASAGLKSTVASRKTGRTNTILGVQAEETEAIISFDATDANGRLPAGPIVKEVLQIWTAQDSEVLRLPLVREWAGYSAYRNYLIDPLGAIRKMFVKLPGLGGDFTTLLEESAKRLVLKTHVELYMPGLIASLLAQPMENGDASPTIDPNAPVMEMNSEIVEFTAVPVDEKVFRLPNDYQLVPVEDLIKSLVLAASISAGTPPVAANTTDVGTIQRIRVGGNMQSANLSKKVTPEYPLLAKQAGIEGLVRLTVVIDREGNVANLQLVSGHPLLVVAATNAVRQWQYKPTLINGRPVEVVTQVDVNFELVR